MKMQEVLKVRGLKGLTLSNIILTHKRRQRTSPQVKPQCKHVMSSELLKYSHDTVIVFPDKHSPPFGTWKLRLGFSGHVGHETHLKSPRSQGMSKSDGGYEVNTTLHRCYKPTAAAWLLALSLRL